MKRKIVNALLLFMIGMIPLFAEKITFSAQQMTGKAGDTSTSTVLNGSAFVKTSTMEIHAEKIELYGTDYRYIKASEGVSGKNLETNMEFKCDSLEFDRETKIAKLSGNVQLVDVDNEVTAEAQIIEYNQNSDIAILQIKINLIQKNNVCNGAYAIYYKDRQILEISGNAQVRQDDDTFRAQHITLDMNTQDITLGGNVKGSITETKKADSGSEETQEASND